jgi:ring-1,2-phenylacetyl-CoA epoxidase subunit PaaD
VVSAYEVAAATPDPELPMLTIGDLGILRDVCVTGDRVVATITPTYSGCPALREIAGDLERRLRAAGYREVTIRTSLAPPWSSDWISAEGRRKLLRAGIAPPSPAPTGAGPVASRRAGPVPLTLAPRPAAACPRCGSARTRTTAAFGSTACTALARCEDCAEPFESIKAV